MAIQINLLISTFLRCCLLFYADKVVRLPGIRSESEFNSLQHKEKSFTSLKFRFFLERDRMNVMYPLATKVNRLLILSQKSLLPM